MMLRVLLAALVTFFVAPAMAQSPFPQVELTPQRVEAVLAAYDPMVAEVEKMGARLKGHGGSDNVTEGLHALMMIGGAASALDGAAQRHGFDGYMDWVASTYAVFNAHAFAQHPDMNDEVRKALAQIDSQEGLSDAQKEQIKASIVQSMGALESMRPSEQNLAAVAPYRHDIQATIDK